MCNNFAAVTWLESAYVLASMCFVHVIGCARHGKASLCSIGSGRTKCRASCLLKPIFSCGASSSSAAGVYITAD